MNLSDDAKAVLAVASQLGHSNRHALSPTQWHHFAAALADAGLAPADVFAADFDPALPGVPDDIAAAVAQLLEDAAATTVAAADLENKGIWTLTIVDDEYPNGVSDRLGHLAPPAIFGVGPTSLLDGRGIGIVGSHGVGPEAIAAAGDVARTAAAADHTVVSGGGGGVDQAAMNAAFVSGGNVVGILADSLQARIRNPDILRALDAGNTTLITQRNPSAGPTPASALDRNKLIYAMSLVTVVIAVDAESGSTSSGAVEAMNSANGVVAVWRGSGQGPGNARLVELGAAPVRSATDVLACLDVKPTAAPEQLSLSE